MQSRLLELLGVGQESASTAQQLADYLDTEQRTVTEAIHSLRKSGVIICSNNTRECKGFYYASDDEEIRRFCKQMRSRISSIDAATRLAEMFLEAKRHDDLPLRNEIRQR